MKKLSFIGIFLLACITTGLFFVDKLPLAKKILSKIDYSLGSARGLGDLDRLPVNQWVEIYRGKYLTRQAHAGIAYDSKRSRLLIFGSNTHGYDWDNSVHEFDPVAGIWTSHYPAVPKETYRTDELGYAVSGTDSVLPWAMHTYDNILYDPELDALIVTAIPLHNPIRNKIQGTKIHPTWVYELEPRQWRIFANSSGKRSPNFFAAASAYDSSRNVVAAYKKGGVWELGPDRNEWMRATKQRHHEIHFNMAYGSKQRIFAVFGDHRNTNVVWVYKPGSLPGEKGSWEKKKPGGDLCPEDQHFPVAYDTHHGVFLLVPDNTRFKVGQSGSRKPIPPESASTFVYDYDKDRYIRLPGADLPPQNMNYMMVYDTRHKVFLLVTGDHKNPLSVKALKLDLNTL